MFTMGFFFFLVVVVVVEKIVIELLLIRHKISVMDYKIGYIAMDVF